MRLTAIFVTVPLCGACTTSPASPTLSAPNLQTTAAVNTPDNPRPAVPEPADHIAYALTGPAGHCPKAVGTLQWTLEVADAGPLDIHLVTFASHEPEPGCEQTIKHGRPWFRLTGPDSYVAHSSGVTTLTYDTRETECGRVQLDMSFIDAAGREQLVYGDVVDYGVPCRVDPPAICPPGAAAILLDFPGRSTRNIQSNPTGSAGTAQFSIAPGCSGIVVSLVSYQKTTSAFLPQQFVDGATGRFDAGGPYSLTVRLASCSMQADLYQGGYSPGEPLDQNNWASNYDPRVLDWIYSGLCAP